MKNKILAILLSFTLIFTTTVLSFAEDEVGSSSEPEKQSEQKETILKSARNNNSHYTIYHSYFSKWKWTN